MQFHLNLMFAYKYSFLLLQFCYVKLPQVVQGEMAPFSFVTMIYQEQNNDVLFFTFHLTSFKYLSCSMPWNPLCASNYQEIHLMFSPEIKCNVCILFKKLK